MLQLLEIANLALLEEASVEFDLGFTAVTGETGAGKSVILGALGLLSGARADKSIVRRGSDFCSVQASLWFENPVKLDRALESLGLPPCEEGTLLLKREVRLKRSSRIAVNGSLATLANLQTLGPLWIDFHGPGEPQRLLKPECQLEMIDLYGRIEDDAAAYRETYDEWRAMLAEIDRLRGGSQLSDEQVEFLRARIQRIDSLNASEESIEELERNFRRVSSSQELLQMANEVAEGLSGDSGVFDLVSQLVRLAEEGAEADPTLAELAGRMQAVALELQELGSEYEGIARSLSYEPEEAQELEERMALWLELKREHGRSVEDVSLARESMVRRIDEQGDIEGTLARHHDEAECLETVLRTKAAALTARRVKAGNALIGAAERSLGELGFKKGRCGLRMVEQKDLRSYGSALPELLFSPNVGEDLLPLAKVASSGELARVMLALKTILADVDDVPLLVFDEVDANVGGEIGREVGKKMKRIGETHQVVCITHLPQVAALADAHFSVEKDQSGSRASVTISRLEQNGKDRVDELARMLGDRKADSAKSHAQELLASRPG